jgi:sugar transferase (PEP-CTERM/EpsH1 system associated)
MKILYLAHTCPYPPNRGDRIRCYHLLNHLSKNYELTLVYPVFDREHDACQKQLRQHCESIFPVPQKTIMSYLSCLRSLFSNHPFSVAYFYSRMLAKIVQRLSPDVVLADCSTMAQYALHIPVPKILDYVDIDSKKWEYLSSLAHFPYSMIYRMESRRLSRFERFLSTQFDHCLVTSQHEKSLLDNNSHITVLPNGVDQQYFSMDHIPTDGSIIFTGVMNYFPNTDAVLHFHRTIFPLIRREMPSAQFVIAGMHPTAQIRKLADRQTTVTGFVPDIRVYLSKAAVCVVPLRVAMGVQNKILEAMAMGVPVVATSMANRGIHATPGQEILLADDPEQFAAATIRLFHDVHLRETLRNNAKQFIEQNFRWEKNLQKLDEVIAKVTIPTAMN